MEYSLNIKRKIEKLGKEINRLNEMLDEEKHQEKYKLVKVETA